MNKYDYVINKPSIEDVFIEHGWLKDQAAKVHKYIKRWRNKAGKWVYRVDGGDFGKRICGVGARLVAIHRDKLFRGTHRIGSPCSVSVHLQIKRIFGGRAECGNPAEASWSASAGKCAVGRGGKDYSATMPSTFLILRRFTASSRILYLRILPAAFMGNSFTKST